jgi:ZIP family zinc transporter
VGGLIAVWRRPGKRLFGLLMGITAGVMISLSFLELVNEAWELGGFLTATIGFSLGALFMFALDYFTPHMRFGEREVRQVREISQPRYEPFHRIGRRWQHGPMRRKTAITDRQLWRTGMLLAVGITIHNIPEGIAVGAGYIHEPAFGIFVGIAILLHNIPEGIATALPLCKSGVCRWDSFRVAMLSGLTEPIGALLAALFLSSFAGFVPASLAFAGGVMVFITLDELLPAARKYGHQHTVAIGIILGTIFVFLLSGLLGV